ncbi:MAG: AraC family transcriptional regulator [Stenotrophobium sp.]
MTIKNSALGWISARHLQHFIARAEAAGLHVDQVLDDAGLVKARLEDANATIPLSAIESMLSAISARYADPLIGLHLAGDIQPATFGAIGYISQACATFADVLDVATRYNGLLSNIGETSVVHGPGQVQLRWKCLAGSAALQRQATEYVLGALVVLARLLLTDKKNFLLSVHFTHARPDDPERVREYFSFFQCPVYFDKPCSCLTLPTGALKIRLRHGDAFIKEALEHHANNMLRQREHAATLPDEVAQLIRAMMIDGTLTRDAIAAQLGISSRSLHRKLEEAGAGYRVILDRVRLEFAQGRLLDGEDSISQISESIGFSSHQAFLRWFKQATGKTPGEYRTHTPASPDDNHTSPEKPPHDHR